MMMLMKWLERRLAPTLRARAIAVDLTTAGATEGSL